MSEFIIQGMKCRFFHCFSTQDGGFPPHKGNAARNVFSVHRSGTYSLCPKVIRSASLSLSLLVAIFISIGCGNLKAEEKVTIGPVEEVILLPWGIKLLARIDTGANTSSLGARNLKINGNVAEFDIRPEYGGHSMKLPIVEWRGFRASGSHELRPVAEMEICLGTKRIRTQINLNDRSTVAYPLLIGRRVLRGRFVVDVSRRERLSPTCPGVNSK